MNSDKYSRSIKMQCPTCGGVEFKFEEDDASPVTCVSCGLLLTRDDLREANEANIAAQVDEVKREAVKDVQVALRDVLKRHKNYWIK